MHSDHKYIEALRQNDQILIRDIYVNHADNVQRWVQSRGGALEDARDVFQEGLIALFEKAQDPAFELSCPLGALLHIICSRKFIDKLRQKGRDTEVRNEEERRYTEAEDADALTLAEESLAEKEKQDRLGRAFEQLSELCRNLLTMLSKGLSPKEVVEQLQMNSLDTLYRRKNACGERWRSLYAEMAI